ncbi:hypothetical protein FOZ62_004537, partial [Perkinsus olseni]
MSRPTLPAEIEFPSVEELLLTSPELITLWGDLDTASTCPENLWTPEPCRSPKGQVVAEPDCFIHEGVNFSALSHNSGHLPSSHDMKSGTIFVESTGRTAYKSEAPKLVGNKYRDVDASLKSTIRPQAGYHRPRYCRSFTSEAGRIRTNQTYGRLSAVAVPVNTGPERTRSIGQLAISERTTHRSALLERRRAQ